MFAIILCLNAFCQCFRFGGGIRPLGDRGRGGGMHVGPDHPIFGQRIPPRGDASGPRPLPRYEHIL